MSKEKEEYPFAVCRLHAERLGDIQADIKQMLSLMTGNGDPSKGFIVRLDRLEQAETRRVWAVRTALAAAFTAIAGLIIKIIRG